MRDSDSAGAVLLCFVCIGSFPGHCYGTHKKALSRKKKKKEVFTYLRTVKIPAIR